MSKPDNFERPWYENDLVSYFHHIFENKIKDVNIRNKKVPSQKKIPSKKQVYVCI